MPLKIDNPMKTPEVDLGSCIGCEICVELAPHAFRINDAGFVEVIVLDDYSDEDIREAIKNCPKDCISWE
jgi:ferredoxin